MTMNTRVILETQDITKNYGPEAVLGGVSLAFAAGESVAIMGPSGSGKTTLLHCLSGIYIPTSGNVVFDGEVVSTWDDARRSNLRLKNFGFVFQDDQLLPELTAVENIALPARLNGTAAAQARNDAQSILAQLGLEELGKRRPAEMSGGQAQRVAIARALANKPKVVFADEPTGALDQASGHESMQLLTTVVKAIGATLILVTHDSAVASWCTRRIEIRDGIVHNDVADTTLGWSNQSGAVDGV